MMYMTKEARHKKVVIISRTLPTVLESMSSKYDRTDFSFSKLLSAKLDLPLSSSSPVPVTIEYSRDCRLELFERVDLSASADIFELEQV